MQYLQQSYCLGMARTEHNNTSKTPFAGCAAWTEPVCTPSIITSSSSTTIPTDAPTGLRDLQMLVSSSLSRHSGSIETHLHAYPRLLYLCSSA